MYNDNKTFFFICGCPRSGTTALWRLFAAHNEISIGCERYIKDVVPHFTLKKNQFASSEFFKHHEERLVDKKYYELLAPTYTSRKVFGDKIPHFFLDYENLFAEIPRAKVLFVMKNIIDFAESFMNRLKDPKDIGEKITRTQ